MPIDRVRRQLSAFCQTLAIETGTWKPRNEDDLTRLPPYKYRRLEPHEIRYILLIKGEEHDCLSIEINHENQGTRQGYAALSYVWGEHNKNLKPILVEDRKVQWVTYNLWAALKRIRQTDRNLVLWVDAICINQKDAKEKSQQLQNMRWIYPRAAKVLCWLGDADESVPEAFNALSAWAKALDDPELRIKSVANAERYLASRRPGSINGLSKLFDRPYWRRAWCLQEVCVDSSNPPLLLCGQHELPWADLYRGFLCMGASLDYCAELIGNNVGYLLPMIKTCWEPAEGLQMSDLVPDAAIREAYDPHDMIFSLLGLAERRGVDYPAPDYEKTIGETCVLYTRAIITADEKLYILTTVDSARDGDTVPSWSMKPGRWAKTQTTETRRLDMHTGGGFRYAATKDSKPQVERPQNPLDPVLRLRGLALSHVSVTLDLETFVEQDLERARSWAEIMRACRAFCSENLPPSRYVATHEEVPKAFIGTITCNDFEILFQKPKRENSQNRLYAAYEAHFRTLEVGQGETYMEIDQLFQYVGKHFSLRGACLESEAENSAKEDENGHSRVHDFLETRICNEFRRVVQNKLAGRKFIVTQDGQFGVGPRECVTEDSVCLLLGSTVPFVLRQIGSNSEGGYQLVGDAYVHGAMYGEGLERVLGVDGNLDLEDAEIWTMFSIV